MSLFNWLISPTDGFAASAEFISDIGLGAFTLGALAFVAAEYAAEHLEWKWGKARKHWFAIGVILGFSGELFFEMGSFRYAYALQASQEKELENTGGLARSAKDNASTALANAKKARTQVSGLQTEIKEDEASLRALRPRELTDDQIKRLRVALRAVPRSARTNLVFAYFSGDQESAYYTYEIGRYFAAERWNFDLEVRTYPMVPLVWGVKVWGPDNATTRAVKSIFKKTPVPFSTDTIPGGFQSFGHMPSPTDTNVFVGPKEPDLTPAEVARAHGK